MGNDTQQDSDIAAIQRYRDYCKTESDEAYNSISKNQEEYDKQLLTLSTGVLAVLVAFLKDIVHLDSAKCQIFLYACLTCLGLTICLVLASFQVSIHALEAVRVYWQKHYADETSYPFPDKLAKRVKYFNIASGILFGTGIITGIIFIIINLSLH